MKIRNGELESFAKFLEEKPEYTRSESRMKRSLIEILNVKFQLFKKEHLELLKQFAAIDEQGNFKLIPIDDKSSKYDIADIDVFNKEYTTLENEEVVIDHSESNKLMLLTIKECVLAYNPKLRGIEAIERDRWHDIVEEINYENEGAQAHVGD